MDKKTYSPTIEVVAAETEDTVDLESQCEHCEEEHEDTDSITASVICQSEEVSEIEETPEKSPFRLSLFPHVSPYIVFHMFNEEKNPNFPYELKKHLKWQLSPITPQLVRKTLVNSGYRLLKKTHEWVGMWGRHMKSTYFKNLKDSQKVNHFPGTFQIGRKDRLWFNINKMMLKHGKKEFGFVPKTFVLPDDLKHFKQVFDKFGNQEKWIVKPPASARGTGIRVVHRWTQIPKKKPVIVQQYLSRPQLIEGSKFDLRLYVMVTSFNPLRIYLYPDGLVRFASVKYNDDISNLSDRFMHLTNYSVNKSSTTYESNADAQACSGHKWTIKTLWNYLEKEQVNVTKLWATIKDMIVKTMIAGEPSISSLIRANVSTRYTCFELFGVDILLDENYKPWLLEVNISPALQSASPLDVAVKGPLVKNILNLAGYQVPPTVPSEDVEYLAKRYDLENALVCQDTRLFRTTMTCAERHKQSFYIRYRNRDDYIQDIIKDLTPDDVRHLVAYEDELTQIGDFEKIFPTAISHSYLQYFDVPRYYNMLFDAWEDTYAGNREPGIERLRKLCETKYHLDYTYGA